MTYEPSSVEIGDLRRALHQVGEAVNMTDEELATEYHRMCKRVVRRCSEQWMRNGVSTSSGDALNGPQQRTGDA